ncbi:MAG: hypothetical protein ABEJ07_03670 [Candidatus Nanohaloarchaea archaeon]
MTSAVEAGMPEENPFGSVRSEYEKLKKMYPEGEELIEEAVNVVAEENREELFQNSEEYVIELLNSNEEFIKKMDEVYGVSEASQSELVSILNQLYFVVRNSVRGMKENLDDYILEQEASSDAVLVEKILDIFGRVFHYAFDERNQEPVESVSKAFLLFVRLIAASEGKLDRKELWKDAVHVSKMVLDDLQDVNFLVRLYSSVDQVAAEEAERVVRIERSADLYLERKMTVSKAAEVAQLPSSELRSIYQDIGVPLESISMNKQMLKDGIDVLP